VHATPAGDAPEPAIHAVTGAFGYSGAYVAERLLAEGHPVRTLTSSPEREHRLARRVEVHPFRFDEPDRLRESLRGVAVLYNTYWVRFDHRSFNHAQAVANSRALFRAARDAGVRRVVHVSITNPSENSSLGYFRGKAILERELLDSGVPHSILRPAVLFGGQDVLINNIAWMLRRFPVFPVFGDGSYRLQPIHVEDLARLAVDEGKREGNRVVDAIGPETLAYRELVLELAAALDVQRRIVSVPPAFALWAGRLLGLVLRDVVITRDEIRGLMEGRLVTSSAPTGTIRLRAWARENADALGRRYASELGRRRDRRVAYEDAH